MRYGHQDQLSWLCLEGAVRYTQAPELRTFLDKVVLPEMGDTMVVDLREVPSIDSTGLGLLAAIGRHCLGHFSRRAVLVCPDGPVCQCLKAMQFDKLFTLLPTLERPGDLPLAPVPLPATAEPPLDEVMLDAHRELSAVDDANRARFEDVVQQLEASVHRHRGS